MDDNPARVHAAAITALAGRDSEAAAEAIRRDISEAGRYLASLATADGLIQLSRKAGDRQSEPTE